MGELAVIARDHALVIVIISSLVSLISGVIITHLNALKDKRAQSFAVKQAFYIDFIVHQLRFKHDRLNGKKMEFSEEFMHEMHRLNAEMLIKADAGLIREVCKLKNFVNTTTDEEAILQQVIRIINRFRKQIDNKPISAQEFKFFVEAV